MLERKYHFGYRDISDRRDLTVLYQMGFRISDVNANDSDLSRIREANAGYKFCYELINAMVIQ